MASCCLLFTILRSEIASMIAFDELPNEILEQCFKHLQVDPMPQAGAGYFSQGLLGARALTVNELECCDSLAALCSVSKHISALAKPLFYEYTFPRIRQDDQLGDRDEIDLACLRGPGKPLTAYLQSQASEPVVNYIRHVSLNLNGSPKTPSDTDLLGRFAGLRSIDILFSAQWKAQSITSFGEQLGKHTSIDTASFVLEALDDKLVLRILRDVIPGMTSLRHLRLNLYLHDDFPAYKPRSRVALETLQMEITNFGSTMMKCFMKEGIQTGTLHTVCFDAAGIFWDGPLLEDVSIHLLRNLRHVRISHDGGLPYRETVMSSFCKELETLSLHHATPGVSRPLNYALPDTLKCLNIHGLDPHLITYLIQQMDGKPERLPKLGKVCVYLDACNHLANSKTAKKALRDSLIKLRTVMEKRGGQVLPENLLELLDAALVRKA